VVACRRRDYHMPLLTTQLQPHAPIAIILRVFLITTVDQSKKMLPASHNLHLS
jgi:hypothetical protein